MRAATPAVVPTSNNPFPDSRNSERKPFSLCRSDEAPFGMPLVSWPLSLLSSSLSAQTLLPTQEKRRKKVLTGTLSKTWTSTTSSPCFLATGGGWWCSSPLFLCKPSRRHLAGGGENPSWAQRSGSRWERCGGKRGLFFRADEPSIRLFYPSYLFGLRRRVRLKGPNCKTDGLAFKVV